MSLLDRFRKEPSKALTHQWNQATWLGGSPYGVSDSSWARCYRHDMDFDSLCRFCLEAKVYRGEISSDEFMNLLTVIQQMGMLT